MSGLKKTLVSILALSSTAAFSGTMGPVCSAVNVTVPCENTAWELGARALYLQPEFSGGDYTYVGVNDATGKYIDNQSWGWGFFIEGAYHFSTGNDANLNWYHLSKSTTKTLSNFSNFGLPDDSIEAELDGTPTELGSASFDPKWDAVNLEFGKHVDFGENTNIRFHGGFQYARIANTAKLYGDHRSENEIYNYQRKPTYNGFGARVGADLSYDWNNGLGVFANGASALLAGSSKLSTSYIDSFGNAVSSSASRAAVVPELEAKLGLTYDYAMAQGNLTLDVGWMWANYFNVVQSPDPTGFSVARHPQLNTSDFVVQGLFFGLNWLGNVA